MPAVPTPHVTAANKYARDVVAGRIPAGTEARQACQRHLDDLQRSKAKGYAYTFDKLQAERVCAFIEMLPHSKGEWAQRGELIRLEPWQCFIVCSLFGWLRRSDGTRRFRVAYLRIPRKNAKSTLAAAIGLYMFCEDSEAGAEIYSGATTEKQAWEIFRPAKHMVDTTPDLRIEYGITSHAKNMSIQQTASRFEPVIGKPGDGASPSCALVDEFHEHQTPDLYDTMMTGMGARRQPLMLVVTTAGFDLGSPCYDMDLNVQQMLSGALPNETLFGMIYSVDEQDDWQDPKVLAKANPNFGISVGAEYLLEQQQDAVRYPSKTNAFLTKHLNKWVSARTAWLNTASWLACGDPGLRLEDFAGRGRECWLGVDLASKSDLAVVSVLLKESRPGNVQGRAVMADHWTSFVRCYLPEAALERAGKNRALYQTWQQTGHLIVSDGDEISFDQIKDDIVGLSSRFRVVEVDYDPWRATHLAQQLAENGATCVEVRNTVQNMTVAMREMESAVLSGRWHHPADPCLTWQVCNVTAKVDAKENIFPRKERPENKIDAAVALLMPLGRAMAYTAPVGSVYERRGVLTL